MKKLLLATALLALVVGTANAGFVNKYSDWRELTDQQKAGYVRGVIDEVTSRWFSDEEGELAVIDGVSTCIDNLEIDSAMMVELVDGAYQGNPNRWINSPNFVLRLALFDLCRREINAERKEHGLDPLSPGSRLK